MIYLQRGAERVWHSIRAHKWILLILIVLQLAFLLSSFYLALTYQVKIIQNAQKIIEPLQNANYDAESIKQGKTFLKDMLGVYQAYQALIKDIFQFGIWMLSLFFLFNGMLWILSQQLLDKEKLSWKEKGREAGKRWLKYLAASLAVLVPYLGASYVALRSIITLDLGTDSFSNSIIILTVVLAILYYFLLAALAVINTSSWKQFIQNTFRISIRKIQYALLVLLINSGVIAASLYLMNYSLNFPDTFTIIAGSGVVLVIVIVLTRLLWISCAQEIVPEQASHEKNIS